MNKLFQRIRYIAIKEYNKVPQVILKNHNYDNFQ